MSPRPWREDRPLRTERTVVNQFGHTENPGTVFVEDLALDDVDDVTDVTGWRHLVVYDACESADVYLSPTDCVAIATALLAGTPPGHGG